MLFTVFKALLTCAELSTTLIIILASLTMLGNPSVYLRFISLPVRKIVILHCNFIELAQLTNDTLWYNEHVHQLSHKEASYYYKIKL
jgi:hypothetical protein